MKSPQPPKLAALLLASAIAVGLALVLVLSYAIHTSRANYTEPGVTQQVEKALDHSPPPAP